MAAFKLVISAALLLAVFGLGSAGLVGSGVSALLPSNVKAALASTAQLMRNLTVPAELEDFISNYTVPAREKLTGPTVRFFLFADPR